MASGKMSFEINTGRQMPTYTISSPMSLQLSCARNVIIPPPLT